jgi:Osmosensitive K+ channel histidine kinase
MISNLIDCLPIGVVLTQVEGQILYCNQVMADWFSLDPRQLQGNGIAEFWPELATYLRWQEAGGRVRLSTPRSWLRMRVLVRKLTWADQEWLVWSFVPEHSRDLEQSQQAFIDTLSHELRTPLTSIKGFVDTLLQSQAHFRPDQIHHCFANCPDAGDTPIGIGRGSAHAIPLAGHTRAFSSGARGGFGARSDAGVEPQARHRANRVADSGIAACME